MGMLDGKKLLVTGIITRSSIAYHAARMAQEEGAELVLTGYGRLSLVERLAARLPRPAPVLELDVTNQDHLDTLAERVGEHTDRLDGVLHSIAYAPPTALSGNFLRARWEDVSTAFHVSTYSFQAVSVACLPLLSSGGSVVGLSFDSARTWSGYDWMGVAKAGLESCARYLARDLGPNRIRVNIVVSGPLRTVAARNIYGADGTDTYGEFEPWWDRQAPLGWDPADPEPTARACLVLLSDLLPATTGSLLYVDGGTHFNGV
ncbi:Enoyl-[acyl-carrier-protein] reductase [NADH] [Streptoalloteichus tenebrarius]|uniref:Enoyl-[acyl-carrier-protein] reductase [NADH] n=1 Tax=Streptoalloteichus tenebrarius (strain ATCC 17920 / DSM 40477 / JCM 4838 / CBS 697.72 / NBRC 16177 / NCIMB 11028 / NRRL B-12390 / A12253. 1 / ISP 5477) TaxID=1933 RepID=A0ABT1HU56_STRSD|nr:enoyl-ACP reductase FabI [Streptoalloteichus tenebrarius]MCP2259049.1 Enoyl-[acyl-carrier-protein] reductase [NADH] [Streptoalloteichus tenebrarius]BFE99625.1 enoyl-ACP reductase FabI [Streptoalloteichus tenebrarius]